MTFTRTLGPSGLLVIALVLLTACSASAPFAQTPAPTLTSAVILVPTLSSTQTYPPSPTAKPTPAEQAGQRYHTSFGIDYGAPDKYLAQGEQTGLSDPAVMGVLLNRAPGLAHVGELYRWLKKEFKGISAGGAFIGVSTTELLLETRQMTGCHDWALVFASFARALGYPTVIVDAAGIPWIKQSQSRQRGPYSGHVFIEVFVDNKWILIDSTNGWYVENGYDPSNPVIPLKAGFPGETADLYGFYVMCKGLDTRDYGIRSTLELQRLMDATAPQVDLARLVKPAYTFKRF